MLIDASIFPTFMLPRKVGQEISETLGLDIIKASVRRRWDAYQKLREVKSGVLSLTDIAVTPDEVSFEVEPSANYLGIKHAVENDLVWSTRTQAVDWDRTIERWCQMLEHDEILVTQIEKIQANDLDQPMFGDFKITLMEYLISCERRGARYYRMTGFQAVRPSS